MRAFVFAGGDQVSAERIAALGRADLVVAADSGIVSAAAAGLAVDLLVGDLDSAPAHLVDYAAEVQRHEPSKDQTDLALALDTALQRGADRITVIGGGGGRLDHLVANLLLLANDDYAAADLDLVTETEIVTIVRGTRTLCGPVGDLVTLVALGGTARGVTTDGLLFPLADADLPPGSSWGVSNEFADPAPTIAVREGVVMAIQPGERGPLTPS